MQRKLTLHCGMFDGGSRLHCVYGALYVWQGRDGSWWVMRLPPMVSGTALMVEAERLEG
jgi:hypothetical protein